MGEQGSAASGRIFISYRRQETAYPAGWLFDRLADHFGVAQIFKDVDSIEPGDDFVQTITTAVGSCDVLLALIGDQWLTITDAAGRRRLDDGNDFVRVEIEAALSRDVRVIPILVEGARMPRADELPASLATLVRRQALELSPSRFESDFSRLLRVLDKTLAEDQAGPAAAAATTAPAPAPSTPPPGPVDHAAAPEAGPNLVRRLLAKPGRLVALAALAVLLVVLIGFLAQDNGGSSNDESPSDENSPSDEGAWSRELSAVASGTFVVDTTSYAWRVHLS